MANPSNDSGNTPYMPEQPAAAAVPEPSISVWARIKEHKIAQWTLAYAAAAYGLLDGTKIVSDAFDWPHQVLRIVTVLLIVGLPVVVTLAWFQGHRALRKVSGTELTIITVLLLVAGAVLWRFARTPQETSTAKAAMVAHAPAARTDALSDKSIAVLPFLDMSEKHDQEYISDGLSQELIDLLAQVPQLRVIARTSSFAFKTKPIPVAEIAKRLEVAHVVEGSIRKSGKQVRISAQLIRTADSTNLWSKTYDRPLDDIFAVQDEIANAIVRALQIRLTTGEVGRRNGGTQNLQAYELLLRAWAASEQTTQTSLDSAGTYAEQAIKLDPSFGMAWLQLGTIYSLKADNGFLPATEGYEHARELAQHALRTSPGLAEAHAQLQYVYQTLDWDWAAAETEQRRALAIDPTDPLALNNAGRLSATLGRWDDAERQYRAALVRDPLDPYVTWNLGNTYYLAGRLQDSESMYRRLLAMAPDFGWTRPYLSKTLLAQGKAKEALAMVQGETDEANRLLSLPIMLQAAGHQAEADKALKDQIARWADTGAFFIAQTYAYRGDHIRTLQWLERAYKQKDSSLVEIVGEPLFKGIAGDPRFKAFLRKMNLPG